MQSPVELQRSSSGSSEEGETQPFFNSIQGKSTQMIAYVKQKLLYPRSISEVSKL